jgi:hypothetical protein
MAGTQSGQVHESPFRGQRMRSRSCLKAVSSYKSALFRGINKRLAVPGYNVRLIRGRWCVDKKYDCLVEAAKNSGIDLPEIKPGASVVSSSSDLRAPDMGTSADFLYEGSDGKTHQVRANDALTEDEGHLKIFGVGTGTKTINRSTAEVAAKADGRTGTETRYDAQSSQKVLPGTVSRTVDKVFGCLDPFIGS